MRNRADSSCELIASLYSRKCDLINIRQKCGVKTVDDIAQTNGQADIDNLLGAEMVGERIVGFVVDGNVPGRALRVTHNSCLRLRVNSRRQWIIAKMAELSFCQTDAPTEHCMGGNSIETTIDDGCRGVSEFRLLRCQASTAINNRPKISELL